MRTSAIIFDKNSPIILDCGEFIIRLYHIGLVPSDQPFHAVAHRHEFFEVHYIDSGKGINKSDKGESEEDLRFGTIYLAKPGEIHEHYSQIEDPFAIYFIGFDLLNKDSLEPAENELRAHLTSLSGMHYNAFYLKPVFLKIIQELSDDLFGKEFVIKGLMLQLITELARKNIQADVLNSGITQLDHNVGIQESIQLLLSNPQKKIKLQELADCARMSQSNYRRLFKKYTGQNVNEYIKNFKMNLARELLMSNCSVKDTAYRLGYESPEHFSKAFKKFLGFSPSEI